ncbi:MAG: GTP-binding protein [Gammaproteobacteria bacterium]|nr:GTP-binding protein [Gammaproteobacteria bacterium]
MPHNPQQANANNPEATKEASSKETSPKESSQQGYSGRVIDAQTKKPIEQALVTIGDEVVTTPADGTFEIKGTSDVIKLRAAGYKRLDFETSKLKDTKGDIALTPFKVKALYLTVYGTASDKIRNAAIQTIKRNNMNALVIDVKGDRGYIPFKVDLPMADKVGAQNTILIKDMPALMADLKGQGLYLIARVVVFKDDMLAAAHPEWAVKKNGSVFRDREKLRWVDPFRKEVWNYNIEIAKAAAKLGFDEVQFDYVRYPDTKGIMFSEPSNVDSRTRTITGFLEAAHKALTPYNVMVAADIFGYVIWNTDDTGIGQQIDRAVHAVDVVSPMLYPSGFHLGIPNYRNPVQHSYEIINLTLKRGIERVKVSPLRFRPWLQAFRDYAFHGGDFGEARMRLQIKATNDVGASGYMFWNPRNVYPTGKFDN